MMSQGSTRHPQTDGLQTSMKQSAMAALWHALQESDRLREIDWQVARQLFLYQSSSSDQSCQETLKNTPDQDAALVVAGLLVSWALGRGQVCLPLATSPLKDILPQGLYVDAASSTSSASAGQVSSAIAALNMLWPTPQQWQGWLEQHPAVFNSTAAGPDAVTAAYQGQPLVLETWPQPRLYLARYFFYQHGLEQQIRQRLALPVELDMITMAPVFADLFPPQAVPASAGLMERTDWQAVAAATACLQRFCVITGGPGTGKTHTVTRLLAALLSAEPDLRIALAAPTGKAAARMTESIRAARERGDVAHADAIPDTSFTLHRLLGWRPDGFRYGEQQTLPYDCIVVDESSMIDLAMMYQLVAATPASARLILLGDRDQLASVEAGSVLADLCNAGNQCWPDPQFAARISALCGQQLPANTSAGAAFENDTESSAENSTENREDNGWVSDDSAAHLQPFETADLFASADLVPDSAPTEFPPSNSDPIASLMSGAASSTNAVDQPAFNMANAVAELKVSRRFTADSGIGQLASAVNQGRSYIALQLFDRHPQALSLRSHDDQSAMPRDASQLCDWETDLLDGHRYYCSRIAVAAPRSMQEQEQAGAEALAAFAEFQALVAVRQGPFGVENLNRHVEQLLTRQGLLNRASDSVWYAGRPIMITRNDYDLGLYNGDIGVVVRDTSGELRVAFEAREGGIRFLLPSRLPSHETSFVMTVHKSQGSEFQQVMLLLPEQWQPVITRELIYTAITRAKERFVLLTQSEVWHIGLKSRVVRASGLRDALWASDR